MLKVLLTWGSERNNLDCSSNLHPQKHFTGTISLFILYLAPHVGFVSEEDEINVPLTLSVFRGKNVWRECNVSDNSTA